MNYTIKAEREYKDTVFTMLFNNKEKLLELYNGINVGKNKELMKHCKTLYEYSLFVQHIRENLKLQNIDEAVKNAVEYCIENNILASFLRKNKAEVIPVAIYECNMDEVLEKIGNDRYEDGYDIGFDIGYDSGYDSGKEEGIKDLLLAKIKIKYLKGKSPEQIADELEESVDKINEYIKQLEKN